MRFIQIIFCLLAVLLLPDYGIPAGKSRFVNIADSYPMGYYGGDPLPEKTAYLTFDDGPSEWTGRILDILREENVKATFFLSAYWNNGKMIGGSSFQKHKSALQRMVKEGHVLGNHTAGHRMLSCLSSDGIKKQFRHNQYYLEKVLGKDAPLMTILRPPLGDPWNSRKKADAKKHVGLVLKDIGMVAMWTKEFDSTDSWDWARGEWYRTSPRVNEKSDSFIRKKARVYNRVISHADSRGMVILMHDTHLVTREVLPSVIRELKARGYVFCTMEDFVVWKYGRGSREVLGL